MTRPDVGVLVLAAGGSARMGRPKQLLPVGGQSLVRRAAATALSVGRPVVVVTGAEAEAVSVELCGMPVRVVANPEWASGMGSSIRAGVAAMNETIPAIQALIITLCDQFDVSAATLARLIEASQQETRGICAAQFGGTFGPPVLFGRQYFDSLLLIPNAHGAKQLLMSHADDVRGIPCPEAARDLDVWADYERLTAAESARRDSK